MAKVFVGIFFLVFIFLVFQGMFSFMRTTFQEIDHAFHSEVPQISLDD